MVNQHLTVIPLVKHLERFEDSMWTIGAYHPITKHLNLVAEYSEVEARF
jgi:hypothetical protein